MSPEDLNQNSDSLLHSKGQTVTYQAPETAGRSHPPRSGSYHDRDRGKVSRKDKRRSDSSKLMLAGRQGRFERTPSTSLSNSTTHEPKSVWSRLFSSWSSPPEPRLEGSPRAAEHIETQPRHTQSGPLDLDGFFLQPAEDSFIQKSVLGLKHSIKSHVDNHYGDQVSGPPSDAFLKILHLRDDDVHLPKSYFNQETFRLAAIRLKIANVIITNISADGDSDTTFLPREIVSLFEIVPNHNSEKFQFAASSVFRRTAANLIRLAQPGQSPAFTEFQHEQVKTAAENLHKQLSVLANPSSDEVARKEQLEAIMAKAAQIGALFLLQPATYEFEWFFRTSTGSSIDDQGRRIIRREGLFVTFPAVLKTGDNNGRELRKAQWICKPDYVDDDDLVEDDRMYK